MGGNNFFRSMLEGFFPPVSKQDENNATSCNEQNGVRQAKDLSKQKPTPDRKTKNNKNTYSVPAKKAVRRAKSTKSIYTHPQLGDVMISHTNQVRRISVSVKRDRTIRLNIPATYPIQTGINFLTSKEQWIVQALKRAEANSPNRTIIPPYRTHFHNLEFRTVAENVVSSHTTADKIVVSFPENLSPASEQVQECIRGAILRTLRAEAKEVLPQMVADTAQRHGFRFGKVSVRATRSRWGSCSGANDISLSIFLMRLPAHLIEYIIIHELCHTVHKDHSARFHALVESHLGGMEKQLQSELRGHHPDII